MGTVHGETGRETTAPGREEALVASMLDKLAQFARSPKGQQVIRQVTTKAQQFASDPRNRAKIEDARRRFMGGGSGPGRTH